MLRGSSAGRESDRSKVRVIVRTKPTPNFPHSNIRIDNDGKTIKFSLHKNSDQLHGFINNQQLAWNFKMDKILHNASQDEVYHRCASDLIGRVLDGFNGSILAFGQTGAGKTHTMTGSSTNYSQRGIIPRAIAQLFREAEEKQDYAVSIRVSYLEIYNDCIRDLLTTLPDEDDKADGKKKKRTSLGISEDGCGHVSVKGLAVKVAKTEEDALNMLFEGEMNRCIAEHALNQSSSRSHCIFTLYVESRSRTHSLASYTVSKLNLVDLAGSERLGKTKSVGNTEYEAKYINKSLTFLEQVTLALTERNRDHIPYRQSKLTHILKDSVGGNCSTVMIANIWVEAEQLDETISTMKFATRMMRICNVSVKNVRHDPQLLLKEYEEEIKALRMELAMHDTLVGKSAMTYEPLSEVDVQNIDRQIKLYVNDAIPELEVRSVRQVNGVFSRFKHLVIATENIAPSSSSYTNLGQAHSESTAIPPKKSSIIGKPKKSQHHVKTLAPPSTADNESDVVYQDSRVGETDGMGFAIGVATPESKSQSPEVRRLGSPVATSRKSLKGTVSTITNVRHKESTKSKEELKVLVDVSEEGRSSPSSVDDIEQVPPPKDEEFEKFKKGRGLKIHEAFLSNKEQCHKKKKECIELADEINMLKKEIDQECERLEAHKRKSKLQKVVPHATDDGDAIIDEVEFSALTKLKQLKLDYRKKYDSLQVEQACLKALSQYVDKARSKLLIEFEEWYRVCYIGGEPLDGNICEEMDIDEQIIKKKAESESERFERLQNDLLKRDPSTAAFYHAQLRTEKRSYSRKQARKPGDLIATTRNKPPGLMAFT